MAAQYELHLGSQLRGRRFARLVDQRAVDPFDALIGHLAAGRLEKVLHARLWRAVAACFHGITSLYLVSCVLLGFLAALSLLDAPIEAAEELMPSSL